MRWYNFFKKFIVYILLGVLIGGVGGLVIGISSSFIDFNYFIENISLAFYGNSSYIFFVASLLGLFVYLFLFYRGKRDVLNQLEHKSDLIEDKTLAWAMTVSKLSLIINFCFYFITIWSLARGYVDKSFGNLYFICSGVFLLDLLVYAIFSKKSFDLLKIYHPEKNSDLMDLSFQKKFIETFDEKELAELSRASFIAYMRLGRFLFYLMIFIGCAGFVMDFGLLPIFLILFINVFNVISFQLAIGKSCK